MGGGRRWSDEELVIAMEFYHKCPERMHTDSHPQCVRVAKLLNRTSSALDRTIRNIKYVDTGGTGLGNASSAIYTLTERYQGRVDKLNEAAAAIRKQNNWAPLTCSD